jgi:hypothetical protein
MMAAIKILLPLRLRISCLLSCFFNVVYFLPLICAVNFWPLMNADFS